MNTIAHLEDELKKAKRDLNFYKTICNRFKSKNKKQKEVIDKAIEYIKSNVYKEDNGCGDY